MSEHQGDLFDLHRKPTYPIAAGWQQTDTSHQAAESVDAETWRARVMDWLKRHVPSTADEIAAGLGASILTIRPRVTELGKLNEVCDYGIRRANASGHAAIVWEINHHTCPDCGARLRVWKPRKWPGGFNQTITCTACSYQGERSTRT